jgi:hypothetical protein
MSRKTMTSLKQIEANRRNASKSTGPKTAEGKLQSRCNAVRHGLTAETVVGVLENAEDYRAFEAAITADYDAQSAVERELVLRLASLLWRLRRALAVETRLLEIQAVGSPNTNELRSQSPQKPDARLGSSGPLKCERASLSSLPTNETERDTWRRTFTNPENSADVDLARCFLKIANLPSFPLDRLSRYEITLWRQVIQTLGMLDQLDRRKPQERGGLFRRAKALW